MAIIERALCPVLVGREEPLTLLEDALLSARRGEGGVVALAGEAGVGKTRLSTELSELAERIGVQVMNGGCSEADLALPYLPFLEAIGNFLTTVDVQLIREALGPAGDELAQLFPQLGTVTTAAPTGIEAGKLRLFEAILTLLQIAADDSGLLLIVEDLHWADASTRELLDYMSRRVKQLPLMVLVTYRRDELHRKHPLAPVIQGWKRSHLALVVDLETLDAKGVEDMVRAILDEREVSEEFRDFLLARTEGNPFVLEEMLKEAIDRGDVYRTDHGWDRKEITEIGIPTTVADNIMLRVERLDPDHADLLRAAAVLGRSFAYVTLREMTGAQERDLQAALEAFVRQQLVEDDPHAKDRYWFRHALTREAIYEDLIVPRRQQLHASAAAVLRSSNAPAAEVAGHLLHAGALDEAVPLLVQAADEAFLHSGYEEAISLYERAIPHLTGLERSRVLSRVGEVMWASRGPAAAVQYLERGIAELEAAGEPIEAAHFRIILGRCYWERGDHLLAMNEYEQARETLEPMGPSADLALAYLRLSAMHSFQSDKRARPLAERAVAIAEEAGADAIRIWAYNALGLSIVGDDINQAIEYIDRSAEEALERNLFTIAENALHNSLVLRTDAGRLHEYEALIARMDRLPPTKSREHEAAFHRGVVASLLGRPAESLEHYRDAANLARATGWVKLAESWGYAAGTQLTEMGRYEEARPLVPSMDPAFEVQDRIGHGWAAMLFARATGDNEMRDRSVAVFRELSHSAQQWAGWLDDILAGFLDAGAVDEAESLWETASGSGGGAPFMWLIPEARIALARGNLVRAIDAASKGVKDLTEAGYLVMALSGTGTLARALGRSGRVPEAAELLQEAHEKALANTLIRVDRELASVAREFGITLEEPAAVADAPPDPVLPVGERLVSVLFADVRGYTSMTNERVPANIAADIAKIQRWAAAEVERQRGIVDKFAGDAVMATFNVSGMSVDHALHALQTAIAILDKASLAGLPMGAGIAVGPAIVGQMTGDANVSVLGETTNLAARLQAKAEGGEIVLSEEAYRRCKDWLAERKLSSGAREFELKGFDGPVTGYVVSAGLGKA